MPKIHPCLWFDDRVEERMGEPVSGPDPAGARRAMETMLEMKKIDLAAIERACAG